MSTLSQILAEKIANENHEGPLKHPVFELLDYGTLMVLFKVAEIYCTLVPLSIFMT